MEGKNMNEFKRKIKNEDMQEALRILKRLIRKQYPEATFEVSPGFDDPEGIDLRTKIDVDDVHEVFDFILPTVFKFQDKGVPIHVIPV